MRKYLADDWNVMKKWWSLWIGLIGVAAMAIIPPLADNYFPYFAPSLLAWFPKHGTQVVPVIGGSLAIAARIINQQELMNRIKAFWARRRGGPHD